MLVTMPTSEKKALTNLKDGADRPFCGAGRAHCVSWEDKGKGKKGGEGAAAGSSSSGPAAASELQVSTPGVDAPGTDVDMRENAGGILPAANVR